MNHHLENDSTICPQDNDLYTRLHHHYVKTILFFSFVVVYKQDQKSFSPHLKWIFKFWSHAPSTTSSPPHKINSFMIVTLSGTVWCILRAICKCILGCWNKPMKSKNLIIIRCKQPIKTEKPLQCLSTFSGNVGERNILQTVLLSFFF